MKLANHEQFWNSAVANGFGGVLRRMWPRHIVCPNGYWDGKYCALSIALNCVELDNGRPLNEPEVTPLVLWNQILKHDCPVYFVGQELITALEASTPPEMTMAELLWPHPAMMFCLPESCSKSIGYRFPYLLLGRVPSGHQEWNPVFKEMYRNIERIELESPLVMGDAILMPRDENSISYSIWSPEDRRVDIFVKRSACFIDNTELDRNYYNSMHQGLGDEVVEAREGNIPDKETEERVIGRVSMLAMKLLLSMTAAPKLVEHGSMTRKPKTKGSRTVDALWSPSFIGRSYHIPRLSAPTEGDGTHASPRMHWRRGHWHHVVHGKGRSLRRLDWFEPTLVNAPK